MNIKYGCALFSLVSILNVAPIQAQNFSQPVLGELFKSTLNTVVTEVGQASGPTRKREILGNFINGMDQGLTKIIENPTLTPSDKMAVKELQSRFHRTYLEFYALEGAPQIADKDLDAYSKFLQQQWEQADVNWNGGVYLSGGVLLLIIIILLIFH